MSCDKFFLCREEKTRSPNQQTSNRKMRHQESDSTVFNPVVGKSNESVPFLFPECVARVPVSFGGLGVRLCSRTVVSVSATVRNRSQPFAVVR